MAKPMLRVFTNPADRTRAANAVDELLKRLEAERDRAVDGAIAALRTAADVRRWQARVRRNLVDILGDLPAKRTPLRPHITANSSVDRWSSRRSSSRAVRGTT